MPDNGVRTIDLAPLATADDLLAHQDGTLGVLPVPALSTRLAASGAVADRLADLDRATSYVSILRPTWAALAELAPAGIGQQAEVIASDTGSHTDPQTSETVANAGRYSAFGTGAGQWTWVEASGFTALDARLAALETVSIDSLTVEGGAVYELGESVTPTLDWTLGGPGSVTAQEVSGAAVAPGTLSWTAPAAITADTPYTLTVTDASDRDVSRSVTVDFRNRVFWGASDSLVTDSAGVLALDGGGSALATARARSFAVTTEGAQYVYYAYPAAWGAPGEVSAYGFPTSVTVTTISLTTAAGHTEEYQLLRLDQAQTGTVPMEVS